MAERIIMNEVKKFEWESMMSMTGNELSKFKRSNTYFCNVANSNWNYVFSMDGERF